jgi:hypothetical protein
VTAGSVPLTRCSNGAPSLLFDTVAVALAVSAAEGWSMDDCSEDSRPQMEGQPLLPGSRGCNSSSMEDGGGCGAKPKQEGGGL